jgi:3-hydroxyacyl-[acyl-carrier-protein] dehydratase
MKFLNNFYTIKHLSKDENTIQATILIDGSHDVYAGHFPGNPVTPGVVQLEVTKELLGEVFDKQIALVSMSNCKYLSVLNPIETPEVRIQMTYTTTEEGHLKVNVTWFHDGGNVMKATGVYH